MSEKDATQPLPQSVTVGQFEFTSVPLSAIDAKKGARYAQEHVLLQSIEILGDNGYTPIVVQKEDSRDEPLPSPELRREEENERVRDLFVSKLAEQQSGHLPQSIAAKLPEAPTSLSELGKYREETPGVPLPPSINPTDNTMLQSLVDTIAKLPDDYKQTLLNYLRAVEDKYENLSTH